MASAPDIQKHIDAAGRRLVHLQGLDAKTAAEERRILDAAVDRLKRVEADIAQLRPRALTDDAAADRYTDLVAERGDLAMVIAQARMVLGE